ncbi:hypothetical protein [Pseudobutyrivibrio sp.]|uniref:hypothetical protein n=1 Tax=Pseudobutyrivibrio sp. TaxID=2014367 RepID=UPI0025DBDEC7|nr:hypothetical protein [Pseudobutyrivibrio sp.]
MQEFNSTKLNHNTMYPPGSALHGNLPKFEFEQSQKTTRDDYSNLLSGKRIKHKDSIELNRKNLQKDNKLEDALKYFRAESKMLENQTPSYEQSRLTTTPLDSYNEPTYSTARRNKGKQPENQHRGNRAEIEFRDNINKILTAVGIKPEDPYQPKSDKQNKNKQKEIVNPNSASTSNNVNQKNKRHKHN